MPQITAIEPQKRKKDRFNIFLDGEFAFGLDAEALVRNEIRIGRQLDEEEVEKLVLENEVGKVMEKVWRFLAVRSRSRREIEYYLKKKEAGQAVCKIIFEKLERYGAVNDFEFAKMWVDSRNRFRPRGSFLLRAELNQKGIRKDIITAVLEKNEKHQFELAQKAAEKKFKTLKNLEYRPFFQKMSSYLLRRGFDFGTAKRVVDSLWEKR